MINELENNLNIKVTNIKEFKDGTYSKVFLINNKYLVKENPSLDSEVEFLKLNNNKYFQNIIYIGNGFNVYNFIEGNVVKSVNNPLELVKILYEIVSSYNETDKDGYGHFYDLRKTFKEFLSIELEDSKDDDNYSFMLNVLDNINDDFKKSVIHGDFGTHNYIEQDGKLVGIIDPEGILGDPIYDLLFGIVSNIDIIKNIDVDLIFNMIGLTKYHYSLLLIVLFNRIKRSKKYHPEDTLEYIKIFDELKVKYETLFSDNI